MTDAYARAERFLHWNADRYCHQLEIEHRWIEDTDSFVYTRRSRDGAQRVLIDAASGARREAVETNAGSAREPAEVELDELRSPDGSWAVLRKDHDLWLRAVEDGSERRLTHDGVEHYGYGTLPGSAAGFRSFINDKVPNVPVALWSPDSRRFATYRLDERDVPELNLLECAPRSGVRPTLHRYRYAFPGDAGRPRAELKIFDVESGAGVPVQGEALPVTMLDPLQDDRVWWSHDGSSLYVIPREEGQQRVRLLKVDAATGAVQTLIEEVSRTYLEIAGYAWNRAVRTLSDGRILWYSERDDWGHLYLYDARGLLIRQVTAGAWKVMDVVRVDETHGLVYFTAVGREAGDPYFRHLYAVSFDGAEPRLLTPEHADHEIRLASSPIMQRLLPGMLAAERASFSPSGRYFIDTFSRPDLPPTTVLRTCTGEVVCVVERADITALEEGGLRMPETFSVRAADEVTPIYGTLHRPSQFDATRKYPVIDVIYPGPQMLGTGKTFKSALFGSYDAMCTQALAELGFIVVTIDGRGTPFRSKPFHDVSYGQMGQAGCLEDHIAGIRQLAARFPFMDVERVGITGHSGGGFASARAVLAYPDFFKVAVSLSGNHDQRGYLLVWGPTYQGLYGEVDYLAAANASLAANLSGKLFLMHGELDDNVHPALTLQLVRALIEAGKEFDMLILPGEDHMLSRGALPYVHRRTFDYFRRYLG